MTTLKDVLKARGELGSVIKPTHLIFSEYFSEFFGKKIYFKPENFQVTGSFKARGAYYKLLNLSRDSSQRRVICVSVGNHAQGVAWASQKLGFRAKVVMPKKSPPVKLRAVKDFGAEVLLAGKNLEEAYLVAKEIAHKENIALVHPYDDWAIIAGQGTIGLEIFEELPDIGTVIVPVGGGGLISGVSLTLKKIAEFQRTIQVVGVRSQSKIAEGISVKNIGDKPRILINQYVDQIVAVEEKEIITAILMLMEKSKLVVEGAGAAGLAALLAKKVKALSDPIVIVLSGGNIDISLLGEMVRKK